MAKTEALPSEQIEALRVRISGLRDDEVVSVPQRQYPDDAGMDLVVSRYCEIAPGAKVLLPHNFGMAIPEGHFGLIVPRSSALHQKGIIIQTGIIDPGYRGEVQTVAYNPSNRRVHVSEGERVSQLLIFPVMIIQFVEADKLPASDTRKEKGFGSSGGFGKGPGV